jgi:sec-independent protein translocase protein TatC
MKLRPIGQEDRLSIIDHLDEVRSRLLICLAALLVVFCVCFWQNNALLSLLNHALPASAKTGLAATHNQEVLLDRAMRQIGTGAAELKTGLAESKGVSPQSLVGAGTIESGAKAAAVALPKVLQQQEKPLVIGVGEGFIVTMAVSAYFAVLITLPLLLYQLYAFVIPALSKEERRVATPTVIAAPVLFLTGAVFTYFAVLPPAVHFLQGYNSTEFQVVVGANSYYKFEIMLMMGIGLAFQVPLLALGLQRVGAITASTLTLNWRYAFVIIAVIVAALPGVDPVTMTMETLPLVALYALSIVLLKWVEHRNYRRARAEADVPVGSGGPPDDSSSAS